MTILTPEALLTDELSCIYDRASKADDITIFAPIAYEFIAKLLDDPLLESVVQELEQDCLNDHIQYMSSIKKIMEKMLPVCKAVTTYVKKSGIKNPVIINELPGLLSSTELYASAAYIQYFALIRVLKHLLEDSTTNHRGFIKKYAQIDEENPAQSIKLFFNLDALDEEIHYLQRMKKTKSWYSWSQLINLYIIYNPRLYEEEKSILRKKKQPLRELTLNLRYEALKRAIDPGAALELREQGFIPSDYKVDLQRLFSYVRRKLLSTKAISQEIPIGKSEFTYRYFDNNGQRSGVIASGNLKHELTGNSAELLFLSVKNPHSLAWDDVGGEMKEKTNVDSARRVINTGFKNTFLTRNNLIESKRGSLNINKSTSIKLLD